MSMYLPMAPESMREMIRAGYCCLQHGSRVGFQFLSKESLNGTRSGVGLEGWCEDSWGMACSAFSSLRVDCGVNRSLIDPMVLVSNTENQTY